MYSRQQLVCFVKVTGVHVSIVKMYEERNPRDKHPEKLKTVDKVQLQCSLYII